MTGQATINLLPLNRITMLYPKFSEGQLKHNLLTSLSSRLETLGTYNCSSISMIKGDHTHLPSDQITIKWKNNLGQLTLIEYLLAKPSRVYDFQVTTEEPTEVATLGSVATVRPTHFATYAGLQGLSIPRIWLFGVTLFVTNSWWSEAYSIVLCPTNRWHMWSQHCWVRETFTKDHFSIPEKSAVSGYLCQFTGQ